MKKRTGILVAAMLALVLAFAPLAAGARAEKVYTEKTFYYTINDGSITITGYYGRDTEETIPNMIAGIPVNTIAEGAFINTTVKKLNLPDSIVNIEDGAIAKDIQVVYKSNVPSTEATTAPTTEEAPTKDEKDKPTKPASDKPTKPASDKPTKPAKDDPDKETIPAINTDDLEYHLEDGEMIITGYTGDGDAVSIPSEIGGYPVSIAENAIPEGVAVVLNADTDDPLIFKPEGKKKDNAKKKNKKEENIADIDVEVVEDEDETIPVMQLGDEGADIGETNAPDGVTTSSTSPWVYIGIVGGVIVVGAVVALIISKKKKKENE